MRVRYDGLGAWYEENARPSDANFGPLAELLGPGSGPCLDLGCGTGHYFDFLAGTGRTAVGLELSADQVRIAARRSPLVVRGDAHRLPFPAATFPTVAALWISTDVDDLRTVLAEVVRVLTPDGRFVLFGVHPCFNGPAVESLEDGSRVIHRTYRLAGWHESAPWWGATGIRSRVGMRHVPLADLFNAVVDAGLRIRRVAEPRDDPVPWVLALVAEPEPPSRRPV